MRHGFSVLVVRNLLNRANKTATLKSVSLLTQRTLGNVLAKNWQVKHSISEEQTNKGWKYSVELRFNKVDGHKNEEAIKRDKIKLLTRLERTGQLTYFGQYPWTITDYSKTTKSNISVKVVSDIPPVEEEDIADVSEVGIYENVLKPTDIHIPPVLIAGEDKDIEEYDCFKTIYGRSAQIRLVMSVLDAAFKTNMKRRHNVLCYGEPGCAKSSVVNGIKEILGPNGFLELDSTATTKAGIEKLFLDGLKTGIPPVVIVEEIEKTDENALRVWLSALDERREIRKVNFRKAKVRKFDIVCIATANDKRAFDSLFRSGSQSGRGALSSRFTKQIYFPRPDRIIMRRILERDIKQFGGKTAWIDPCLDLADQLDTTDPREVMSLLVGGDRLLSGQYQNDVLSIHKAEKAEK